MLFLLIPNHTLYILIMATAYEEIEKGTLNKAEVIDDIKIMINKIREIEFINKIPDLYFKKANNVLLEFYYLPPYNGVSENESP